jgi:arylsulfatase A-like enzyme
MQAIFFNIKFRFTEIILLWLILYPCLGLCQKSTASSPNIIIIFCDDLGYGDIPMYGGTQTETPHLNQLAKEGVRFTEFYAAQAVCSASRAGLLTGCYPNRIGISGALGPGSKTGINENETTLAEILKTKGYATGIFGKWHLGDQEKFLPLQHGFDSYFGLPYSNDMWPVNYDGIPLRDTSEYRGKYPLLPLYKNNQAIETIQTLDNQATLTTRYTEEAIRFIHANKQQPFFVYLPHSMPHVPLAVSAKFKGKSKQGLYGDVLMEIDWSVGEIMKTLKANHLDKNTLLIFTSDNGPWMNFGNHAGSTGGLREGKGTSFEGGQKVPCIMRWPGKIPAGSVCTELAATIDLLPTITKITNASLPAQTIDGLNILPLLLNPSSGPIRTTFYYYYRKNSLEAVRNEQYKLVFPHEGRSYLNQLPGKDGFPGKAPENVPVTMALFDLRRDPGERYDVQTDHPAIVQQLMQLAEKAREELGDDLQKRKGKGIRPAGKLN